MADVSELQVGSRITINPGSLNVNANPANNGTTYDPMIFENSWVVARVGDPGMGPNYLAFADDNGVIMGGQWAENVTVLPSAEEAATETVTEDVPLAETPEEAQLNENEIDTEAIDSALAEMMTSSYPKDIYKFNMRLFGIPHQFTHYADYRTVYDAKRDPCTTIGRKFLENIVFEAPVLTIIPGKPDYLPGAKNKVGLSQSFIQATVGETSSLLLAMTEEDKYAELRYYDFRQDYFNYMQYVNILCQISAAFLELGNVKMLCGNDEVYLTEYRWQHYRWNSESYSNALGNILGATWETAQSAIEGIMSIGSAPTDLVGALTGEAISNDMNKYEKSINGFDDPAESDDDFTEALENLTKSLNFVQFYVDASTGISETITNNTSQSKLSEIYNAGESFLKEAAFIANSGGLDAQQYQEMLSGAGDAINQAVFDKFNNSVSGFMERLVGSVSNVIRGENMIFPQIYQSSEYTKNYSFTIDLRSPYGNKLSYYLNVIVPLMHLICLALPKQTTANSYGAPFLLKCYYPGACACNLGIVQSMSIDKNPNGESWTIDGYPGEIRVTMNVVDLYSDLTIVPAGIAGLRLFVSNSSLIEYLAVQCGIDLVTPQIEEKADMYMTAITSAWRSNLDSFGILEGENFEYALKNFLFI